MRRRRAMGMGVAVVVPVVVGMVVRHEKMLHYNITGVHVLAFARPPTTGIASTGIGSSAERRPDPRRMNAAADWGDQLP
jgi:hypothetical protein